jgi:transglutaminase-like putative cysteine protease
MRLRELSKTGMAGPGSLMDTHTFAELKVDSRPVVSRGPALSLADEKRMETYLQASKFIDFDSDIVRGKAAELAAGLNSDLAIAESCYQFVRDEIRHSWDYQMNPVTCSASEVLRHRTGYCYAKSHLLAALLRANGIPAGLCYQRLSVGDSGAPYCLHGLNAVFLSGYGWYRCDARGNKVGVTARFTPPHEALAFPIKDSHECDLPEVWAEPLPVVTEILARYSDVSEVQAHLPDVVLWGNQSA